MSAYAGTGRLVRLALRRDRVQLPVWVVGSAVVLLAGAAAVKSAFPTEASAAQALHAAGNNPTVDLLRGVPVGDTTGALVNFRNLAFMLVLAALMSTFAVVRHTRQNEETGRSDSDYPVLFPKFASSMAGPFAQLELPPESHQIDYEGELTVVIGKKCRNVAKEKALSVIAGYACFNDGSVRDWQRKSGGQFTLGKNFDGTGAFGPWMVTADELPPGGKG